MGGFAEQLGSEQKKISAVEAGAKTEKEKAAELAATLERNHATFFGEVDSAKNALNTAESSLTDTNDLQTVGGLKDELKGYLVSVAATGNEALRNAQQGKPAEQAKLARINSLAGEVNTKSAELKNTVPFFIALEKGDGIYKTKAKPEMKKIEGIKNDDKLTPAQKREQILQAADDAIDALGEAKQAMPANAPEDLAVVLQETLKPIHAGLEEAGRIKFFYAVMDLSASDEYNKYIVIDAANGGTIKFTDAYKALAPEQQQEVQMAIAGLRMKIESEIEAKTCSNEHEKSFYSGKQKLLGGDKPGAKTDLLAFYNTEIKNDEHSPENTQRLSECRELLKQIALFEIAEAEGRLNTIAADIKAQWADMTTRTPPVGMNKNLAYVYISNMRQVIEMARERINTGDALTVANVYKDLQAEAAKLSEGPLRSWSMGFQSEGKHNLILDVLRTQQEIDNSSTDPKQRRAKLIEKAKEARELGLFSLSKQYYEKAFQPEIDAKRKEINREDFISRMRSDAEIQENIKIHVDLWEKDFRPKFIEEFKAQHDGAAPTEAQITEAYGQNKASLREQLFNQMAGEAYGKALRTLVHRDMMAEVKNAAPGALSANAAEWNLAYGATFVNMETFDVGWGEFWKFTDAEWNAKKWEYIITLATTMASGGIAAGLARGTVGAVLTRELAQQGLAVAAKAAMKKGAGAYALFVIRKLGAKRAASYGITSLGVESGAFAISNHAMNRVIFNEPEWRSVKDFMKAWGHSAAFLGGCKIGSLGYSFRPVPVTTAGRILDTAGYLTSEVAASTAMMLTTMLLSGETITAEKFNALVREDIIMTIGMHGAHKLIGAGEAGEHAPRADEERAVARSMASEYTHIPAEAGTGTRRKGTQRPRAAMPPIVTPALAPVGHKRARKSPDRKSQEKAPVKPEKSVPPPPETGAPVERYSDADRAFMRECDAKLDQGGEVFLRWKDQLQDPRQFLLAERVQAKDRQNRIASVMAKFEGLETAAECFQMIERINKGGEITTGTEWAIVKNLEFSNLAVVLAPDGQLHLLNNVTASYDYARYSMRLKNLLRSWDQMDVEAKAGAISEQCGLIKSSLESGTITAEARERILSGVDPVARDTILNPSTEKIRTLTTEQVRKVREAILKLRNEGFRTERAKAREKAQKTILLTTAIEDAMREQLKNKPDITREELYRVLDLENNPLFRDSGFYGIEKMKIKFVVDSLFEKSKSINNYFSRFKDNPKALFKEVFGFKPEGDINIGKTTFSLFFEIADVGDYSKAVGRSPDSLVTSGVLGHSFPTSGVAALEGLITTIRYDENVSRSEVRETIIHEEQHNINRFVFYALHPNDMKLRGLGITGKESVSEQTAVSIRYLTERYELNLARARDEVLAQLAGGEDYGTVKNVMSEAGQIYDYWGSEIDGLRGRFERSGAAPEVIEQALRQAQELRGRHRAEVAAAMDAARAINDPALLMITDIRQWKNLKSQRAESAQDLDLFEVKPKVEILRAVASGQDVLKRWGRQIIPYILRFDEVGISGGNRERMREAIVERLRTVDSTAPAEKISAVMREAARVFLGEAEFNRLSSLLGEGAGVERAPRETPHRRREPVMDSIIVGDEVRSVRETIKDEAIKIEQESAMESRYSLLDQINGLPPEQMLSTLQLLDRYSRLSDRDLSMDPIINPENGLPMEASQLFSWLENRVKTLEAVQVGAIIANNSIGKEIEIFMDEVVGEQGTKAGKVSMLRQKGEFTIEKVIRTANGLQGEESGLPAGIREKFKEGENFIIKVRNNATHDAAYQVVSDIENIRMATLLGEAMPGGFAQLESIGHTGEFRSRTGQPANNLFNYSRTLLEAGREINKRTDLTSEQKRAAIREKVRSIREEIAQRTGALASAIEGYLDAIQLNPDYSPEKMMADIDANSDLAKNYRPEEISRIKEQVAEFLKKTRIINTYYDKYKGRPETLFEMQFGFKPQGEVKIIKQPFALSFNVLDIRDIRKVREVSGGSIEGVENVAGTSFPNSPIPGLAGFITTVHGDSTRPIFNEIIAHETRHNINRAIYRGIRGEDVTEAKPKLADRAEAEKYLQSEMRKLFVMGIERAQDEILAYMKGGSDEVTTDLKLQNRGGSYDYWRSTYEADIKTIYEKYQGLLPPGYYATTIEPQINHYVKKHYDRVKVAVELAYQAGLPRLDELAVTPILQWPTLFEGGGKNPYLENPVTHYRNRALRGDNALHHFIRDSIRESAEKNVEFNLVGDDVTKKVKVEVWTAIARETGYETIYNPETSKIIFRKAEERETN